MDCIKESKKGKAVGVFSKDFDKFPGAFMTALRSALDKLKVEKLDVSVPLAYVMASREESEVGTIKKACQATMDVFTKYLKEQLMDIIDNDKVRRGRPWRQTMMAFPDLRKNFWNFQSIDLISLNLFIFAESEALEAGRRGGEGHLGQEVRA